MVLGLGIHACKQRCVCSNISKALLRSCPRGYNCNFSPAQVCQQIFAEKGMSAPGAAKNKTASKVTNYMWSAKEEDILFDISSDPGAPKVVAVMELVNRKYSEMHEKSGMDWAIKGLRAINEENALNPANAFYQMSVVALLNSIANDGGSIQ